MKPRYLFSLLLLFFCYIGLFAKNVKLGDGIVYEGDVLNGVPNGKGILYLRTTIHYTSGNVHHTPYIIEGDFDGNIIRNATLSETRSPSYDDRSKSTRLSGSFVYDIREENGEKIFVLQVSDDGTCLGFHKSLSHQTGRKEWKQIDGYNGSMGSLSAKSSKSATTKKEKVKYSKSFVYEGEAADKTPQGTGMLKMNSLTNKNIAFLSVSGDFDNTTVNNAVICLNNGITIKADRVAYRMITSSDKDEITVDASNCTLDDGTNSIHNIKYIDFSCYRMAKDKASHINLQSAYIKGFITSNFIQDGDVQTAISVLREDANNINTEEIGVTLNKEESEGVDDKVVLSNRKALAVHFTSGISVQLSDEYNLYKYPNGDYVKTVGYNKPLEYQITLSDGCIKVEDNNITLTYSDGRIFKSNSPEAVSMDDKFIADCKSISDIKLLNGQLQQVNKTIDTYVDGNVLAVIYPLKDNGRYIKGDSYEELIFPYGSSFKPELNGLKIKKELTTESTCDDFILLNGVLENSGKKTYYHDGAVMIKSLDDITLTASPIDRETADLGGTRSISLDGKKADKLKALLNNDVAGYLDLPNIKTDLQKKAFTQTVEYKNIYLPRLQEDKSTLLNSSFYVKIPVKAEFTDLEYLKYDVQTDKFVFELRDTENGQINKGMSDFHFLLYEYLCLSYPRSLVSLTTGKNYFDKTLYIQKATTCKVPEADALQVENNINHLEMVWVFKLQKVIGNKIYGKTTNLYLANTETGEIYADLSASLGGSQAKFNSVTVVKDNTPKTTYHARGRQENCFECGGKGYVVGWREHQRYTCHKCGGKGWYIEHYW